MLFNANGAAKVASGTTPNTGHTIFLTGRGDKAAKAICGCYDVRFWSADDDFVGDCTICVDASGNVTGGNCSCNTGETEYLSQIVTGAYTLPFFTSSTGYLWFETSSDLICGQESALALDFEPAKMAMKYCSTAMPAPTS